MKGKLLYGDAVIWYSIIQTKRKKTMQVIVEKDNVEVRAPQSKSTSEIKKILQSKTAWIFNKQLALKEQKHDVSISANSLVYLGKNIPFSVQTLQKSEEIIYKKNQFIIKTKSKSISQKKIQKLYFSWLATKYTSYIGRKIKMYSKLLGVKPHGFKIKNLKSKWGSVIVSGQIHLNFHLLKTPRKIIDYVILHELAHLRIKGHRREFWAYLNSFMPDYEKRKSWLDQNQVEIMRS